MVFEEEEGDDCDASLGSSSSDDGGAVYEEEPTNLKKGVEMKGLSKVKKTNEMHYVYMYMYMYGELYYSERK